MRTVFQEENVFDGIPERLRVCRTIVPRKYSAFDFVALACATSSSKSFPTERETKLILSIRPILQTKSPAVSQPRATQEAISGNLLRYQINIPRPAPRIGTFAGSDFSSIAELISVLICFL